MTGFVCLQGGGEFSAGCLPMDADLVARAPGRVVVSALAGTPGRDYATATANGVRHFLEAGAADVVAAPDVRHDEAGALAALRSAALVVLPGGSPARLLETLCTTGAGAAVAGVLAAGGSVMGASAGAMVLCGWTLLPGPAGLPLARGLALVPELLVVPHWTGEKGRDAWTQAARQSPAVAIGLPEESGVVLEAGVLTAVGLRPSHLLGEGRDLVPGQTFTLRSRTS